MEWACNRCGRCFPCVHTQDFEPSSYLKDSAGRGTGADVNSRGEKLPSHRHGNGGWTPGRQAPCCNHKAAPLPPPPCTIENPPVSIEEFTNEVASEDRYTYLACILSA